MITEQLAMALRAEYVILHFLAQSDPDNKSIHREPPSIKARRRTDILEEIILQTYGKEKGAELIDKTKEAFVVNIMNRKSVIDF